MAVDLSKFHLLFNDFSHSVFQMKIFRGLLPKSNRLNYAIIII